MGKQTKATKREYPTLVALRAQLRQSFPVNSALADQIYRDDWGHDNLDDYLSAYSWLESLAKALNSTMQKGMLAKEHQALLETISQAYLFGSTEVQNGIDVAFTENLFWGVSKSKAEPHWHNLPAPLQRLYLNFFGHPPC